MATKVILHVGSPKTGTSLLQEMFFAERERLSEQGILYPAERFDAHFLAALDLMDLKWGGLEAQAVGAWDRLAAEVRDWPGTVIISHEILARATPDQVARALASLGGEVHIVLSARDLVRQIPAEWQENVKHRRVKTYADFLDGIRDPERSSILGQWFWGVQETPAVLERWGAGVPREQVHLVTVPPPGAPKDQLWQRFAQVFGFDPQAFPAPGTRANHSLGVAEATAVRRLNEQIATAVPNHHYRALVRESLVHQNLSQERASSRISVPDDVWAWAEQLSRTWVAEIALQGYDVVGDLDDLVPQPALPYVDPAASTSEEQSAVLLRALTAMTVEAARLRDEIELRDAEIGRLHGELAAVYATRTYRMKQRLVAAADNSRTAAVGLAAYRRLRGKNSRST
ncbi:hypothetical protein EFK50_09430 [Nocardioides marmoriginsengisoli]|uniref:Sulfotransferase family protein n=1 Tax=Nocardioides marmoriginsengisoli TaxID=661483 RepID=A0A3N0CF32_9ACTN|nr:hypothetical protein [Nocardioides marmoriginsengisoli]RNL62038.1 hypothetical protein EFK50_09430 [Nocardioides marmoriginsengisoli]